jgi:hypothetical protein
MVYVPLKKVTTSGPVLTGTLASTTGGSIQMKLWKSRIEAYAAVEETTGDGQDANRTTFEQADLSYVNIELQGALVGAGTGIDLSILHSQTEGTPLTLALQMSDDMSASYNVVLESVQVSWNFRAAAIGVALSCKGTQNVLARVGAAS